jgi:hypothetical protein
MTSMSWDRLRKDSFEHAADAGSLMDFGQHSDKPGEAPSNSSSRVRSARMRQRHSSVIGNHQPPVEKTLKGDMAACL